MSAEAQYQARGRATSDSRKNIPQSSNHARMRWCQWYRDNHASWSTALEVVFDE